MVHRLPSAGALLRRRSHGAKVRAQGSNPTQGFPLS